ncbi:hypothetical protein SRB17_56240 [Streptomyces sp. RB17]|nr:hypothetical protein [Streptomyces sp. RB17]
MVAVVEHEVVDDGRRGRHHDHVRGPVRRPAGAHQLRRALLGDRRGQRVAAGAAHAGDAVAVHQHRGARLENRLVGGGSPVAVAVVGDPGVDAQLNRGQRAQVGGHTGGLDAGHGGKGLLLAPVGLEERDLLLDVAGRSAVGAAVQAGRSALDSLHRVGRTGGRGGGGGRRRGGTLLRGGFRERVLAAAVRGLQEDLAALGGGSSARTGEHHREGHGGDDGGGECCHPRHGLPPRPLGSLGSAATTTRRLGGRWSGRGPGGARQRAGGRPGRAAGGRRFGAHEHFFPSRSSRCAVRYAAFSQSNQI